MKPLVGVQAFLGLIGSAGCAYFLGQNQAFSYALGAGIVFLNVVTWGWIWNRLSNKKQVALAVSVIVVKYPILGSILYLSLQQDWLMVGPFLIGLTTLLPSVLWTALVSREEE